MDKVIVKVQVCRVETNTESPWASLWIGKDALAFQQEIVRATDFNTYISDLRIQFTIAVDFRSYLAHIDLKYLTEF